MPNIPELSIVIPCYNEEEGIVACHETLVAAMGDHVDGYEIIYVNDGSSDNTFEILKLLQLRDARIRVVDLARNFGHQLAVSAGLEYASGKAVAIMDADLQDPPAVLLQMVDLWRQGWDVIFGVRRTRVGESWFKLATAKAFYRLLNLFSDVRIPLDTGDFRLMDRRALEALLRMREGHRLLRGMCSWIGFRQYGLEYDRASRFAGETKYPFRKMFNLALDGVLSFSIVPLRLVSVAGALSMAVAMLGTMYAVILRLFTSIWVPGWTLLFIAMLLLGGFQMLSLGIVGEYVGRIYTEAKRRPLYLVRDVIGGSAERRWEHISAQTGF